MKKLFICAAAYLLGCQSILAQAFSITDTGAKQLVVVTTTNWDKNIGTLQTFDLVNGNWQAASVTGQVNIGRTGLAWGLGLHPKTAGVNKVEGDGKAPAGVFKLGDAFGKHTRIATGLNYQQLDKQDYCIDVVGSPYYNQTISTENLGKEAMEGSSEPMRRDLHKGDNLYAKGIFVKHNPENISGAGSCIFIHIWRDLGKPTAGCTAMSEAMIDDLLAWLNKDKSPIFVILPVGEYQARANTWALPPL